MNIWKIKIWLSQEQKEPLRWNKKHFRHKKQSSKKVADTTYKTQTILANKTFSLSTIVSKVTWAILLALADWHRSSFERDEDDASKDFMFQ